MLMQVICGFEIRLSTGLCYLLNIGVLVALHKQ